MLSNKKQILYGAFYRPPNSDAAYTPLIEDSIGLATDTNISDIIITGDFNFNQLNPTYFNKIQTLCSQYKLSQCIEEPTHFTENSNSLIDLLLVSNKDSLLTSGLGEPCLDNNVRYHCPVFGVFNFIKPKIKTFKRKSGNMTRGIMKNLDTSYAILIGIEYMITMSIPMLRISPIC